jgi:Holliday junction resolvase RusA-like endonuclease
MLVEPVGAARASCLRFTVAGDPVPKQPGIVRGTRVVKTQKVARYEMTVRLHALQHARRDRWTTTPEERFSVEIRAFVRDMRWIDCDNIAKSVLDGLKKVAFPDDNQVDHLIVRKAVDPVFPRVEITIQRVLG